MNLKLLKSVLAALVCFSAIFCLGNPEVRADEETPAHDLGEIVVSGKIEGVQASQSVYAITSEDIENRNARTLDQAINLLPGVSVRVGGEGTPRIDVRGFRTRHVILLLDGVPINSALDGQFDPTLIPTENIAKIKLTTGASSVLYGQGGLGGVINIITKKGAKGLEGKVGAEIGDHESYLTRASLSGGNNGFDFFMSGSSTKATGFPLSSDFKATSEQEKGYRNNADAKRNNLFGGATIKPKEDLNLGFTIGYSEGSFGKPGSILNEPLDPFASPPKYERIDHFSNLSLQVAGEYDITRALSIRGWTFLNQGTRHDNLYDNRSFNSTNLAAGSFRQQIDTRIIGVTLQPKYDMGKVGVVTFSLGAERDGWKNDGFTTTAPNTFERANDSKSFNIYSTAIEYEISPVKNLGFVAGYGHYWQKRDEKDQEGYSLLGGVHYDVFADTRLKAAYKRDIRFPTLGDLYAPGGVGNPNLVMERSKTYEAGIEQKLVYNTLLSVTGFYTSADNLIQTDQATQKSENIADIDFSGVETSISSRPLKRLFVRASYTYMNSKDKARPGNGPQQYTPGDRAAFEANYAFDSGLTLYGALLYVGDQYFYTKNNVSPMQRMKLDNYSLVNLKVSQRVHNRINLYVGVNNLLDRNYESAYGFPQAGRFVYGGVEFKI